MQKKEFFESNDLTTYVDIICLDEIKKNKKIKNLHFSVELLERRVLEFLQRRVGCVHERPRHVAVLQGVRALDHHLEKYIWGLLAKG